MNAGELPQDIRAEYPFASHWLTTPGGQMHYVDEGPRDAPAAVICVHGNPTWSFMYRHLVKALSPQWRVIAPDHLGCGLSDKPQDYPYRLENHIENLLRLVNTLPQRVLHFVVHDWGGPIGLGVAEQVADRTGRIVIMNTAAFRGPCPDQILLCRIPLLGPLLVRGLNGFAGPATWMAVTRPLPRAVKRGYLWPYRSWKERVAVQRFVEDIPLDATHVSAPALQKVEDGLAKIRDKPILIEWGMEDFCFTPFYLGEWHRLLPRAHSREFPDAGHYLLEDAGAEVIRDVQAFLEGR